MNKLFSIVLYFFWQNLFCQEYHFDKAILYTRTDIENNNTQYLSIFINSKNQSYHFVSSSWGNEMNCYLIDKNTEMSHKYYLESLKDVTDFTYEYSWKFSRPNHVVNCENFVANEIKLDSLHTKIEAINYSNKKKKRIDYQYIFILKPIDVPILNTITTILQHHRQLDCLEFTISQNNIPSSIKYRCNKGCNLNFDLVSIKDTDVDFQVKEEDIKFKNK